MKKYNYSLILSFSQSVIIKRGTKPLADTSY